MNSEMYQWLENSIREHYQFVRTLKKASNKEIDLYMHKRTGKCVVVKKMKEAVLVYDLLVSIRHPALVEVIEAVSCETGSIIVEEYIDAVTIADFLEMKVFSLYSACYVCMQICDALHILHLHNIIHRDIKPENIFILPDYSVKIADYDAARIYKDYEVKDTRVLGTVGYAAPEQYGEAQTDEKSDIYALGVLLNVMLTGKHPSQSAAKGKIGKIIEKCTMMDPNKRYRDIIEVKKQLKKFVS